MSSSCLSIRGPRPRFDPARFLASINRSPSGASYYLPWLASVSLRSEWRTTPCWRAWPREALRSDWRSFDGSSGTCSAWPWPWSGDPHLAEDVAQQTFERAWRRAASFDPGRGSVRTWLTTIAHNLAIDAVRARKPTPVDPDRSDPAARAAAPTSPSDARSARESADELRAALGGLPAEQARAVVMAGVYGMTAQEVAAADGVPLGTAKTRIRSAMMKLRLALDPEAARP